MKLAARAALRLPDFTRLRTLLRWRSAPVLFTRSGLAVSALCIALLAPARAGAQAVLGIGDDALTVPAGSMRVSVFAQWLRYYERYGRATPGRKNGAVEPLGVDFNFDTIGVAQFENLVPAQNAVRALAAMPDFTASLGKSSVLIRDNVLTTPIAIDFGITRRISVSVVVPFVTATSTVDFRFNPTGREPTLGFNPTLSSPSTIAANGDLLTQFDAAAAQLNTQLASCAANPAAAGCAALNANAGSARALILSAGAFAAGLAQVYGGRAGSVGSPFVPVVGTAAQTAIKARLAAFKAQYAGFGNNAITGSVPLGAAPMTISDAATLFTNKTFGLGARPLERTINRGIGDIDVGLKVKLFDTFGEDPKARLAPHGLQWRQSIGAVYRIGTGTTDAADNFADVGTGNHQNDVELRSYTDLMYGKHFWVSVLAHFNFQLADQLTMRITDTPSQVLAAAYRQQTVQRDLGDVAELEIDPRWVMNDYMSISGHYYYRRKSADRYTGTFNVTNLAGQPVTIDASALNQETEATEHRLGVGFSYSTLAAYMRGKAGLPFEISYFHFQTTLGSGGNVPKLSQDQVQVRMYRKLFGR